MCRHLLILFLIVVPFTCAMAQNARTYIKAADQFIINGYYEDAISQYNQAINIDPQNGEAYEARAKAYLALNKLSEAGRDFERAAVFETNIAQNYYYAADIFYKLDNIESALLAIEKAINKNPGFTDAYILQFNIYFKNKNFTKALESAQKAVNSKSTAHTLYIKGKAEFELGNFINAEQDFEKAISKDKFLLDAYLALARLQVELNKFQLAIGRCDYVLLNNKNNSEAYAIRSLANKKLYDPQKAINDISSAISIDPSNMNYILQRGECYMDLAQYTDAINDFNLVLSTDMFNLKALYNRANAYEKLSKKKEAASDYSLLLTLSDKSDFDFTNLISEKIYLLQQEYNKPVISISTPSLTRNFEIPLSTDKNELMLKGNIADESKIKLLRVNNDTLINSNSGIEPSEFKALIEASELEFITISATDIYNNISNVSFSIARIETQPPVIDLMNPYVGDDNLITLNTSDNFLYLEGKITDKSLISGIRIDELNASFAPGDINPRFTATVDISKKNKIKISVSDIYGNFSEKEYLFVRDGRILNEDSPMGKTWAILIDNAEYKSFTNLHSTSSDIELIRKSLDRYKINNTIVKKNLTKRELERFFSIELRDLIRTNQVNSLFIWFAGHGINLNGNGYWIPSDAIVDDEFTYYNINALKASLYSYNTLTHLLVVSDACSTGTAFSVAMRSPFEEVNCSHTQLLTSKKSAQVISSSGSGSASDNSLFAQSFSNSLLNNENDCLSIDEIAKKVTIIMQANTYQNPEFGRISGLEDQSGTFFFIAR